jgi:putative addiction module component (TIGR02574 family)
MEPTGGKAMTLQELMKHADALPDADRLALADHIYSSIAPTVEDVAEFDIELQRRIASMESGEDPGIDAEELLTHIRRDLN